MTQTLEELKREAELRELLYRCIVELYYVQCTDLEMCASSRGADLVESGMKLLGVKDLSEDTYEKAPKL